MNRWILMLILALIAALFFHVSGAGRRMKADAERICNIAPETRSCHLWV